MKYRLEILCFLVIMFSTFCSSQVIQGTLKFQSDHKNYNFIRIKTSNKVTSCDSNGFFQIELQNKSDTLDIIPIPNHIKVKVYNISGNLDTIKLFEIPIFMNVGEGIPIVNFRTKRTSKKFFKQFEKNRQVEIEKLDNQIKGNVYLWENKEYKLRVLRTKNETTLYINLGM